MWFTVRYRCAYREFWYEDSEGPDYNAAVGRASLISALRGVPAIVTDEYGTTLYRTF